ncbi:hypothetical protein [Lewinella cohaerens]|uniref:hypothetical protein n=1 Tax=Lewinella cohaerens TaxID=70995 RepID=UPI0003645892|nr:hypothetical protein [Lewinella cohaerens]
MLKGPNQIIDEVKAQISQDDINSAIQGVKFLIEEYSPDDDLFNSATVIENENSRLQSNQIKGILTFEQYSVSYNNVVNSILNLVGETKESITKREKDKLYFEQQAEQISTDRNEEWRKFPKHEQIDLAFKGEIKILDPVKDSQLYYYSKKGELFKKHSLVGQLQYLDLQKTVAKNEVNHKRKLGLYSIVCGLYEILESEIQEYLSFKEKKNTLWKSIEKFFRKDLIDYTEEDKWKVKKLKEESHDFYNEKSKELSRIESDNYRRNDFKSMVLKIQKEVVEKKKKLENFIVAIPGENVNWFTNGYLWYCNFCTYNHTNWYREKGDWIEYGSPILSQYNKGLFSPFNGLLLKKGVTVGDNPLWYMIPEKGTDLTTFKPSFVYGEFIDYIHENLNSGKTFAKYSETNFYELLKDFEKEKLQVSDIDDETKELLIASGIKN